VANPKVAVFCRTFLSYSETFIYDELRNHARWDADVFCRDRTNTERFPYQTVITPGGAVQRRVYQATSYSPTFMRALRDGGHRVLHAHYGTTAINTLLYQRYLRLPLVVTFHGFDVGVLVGPRSLEPWKARYRWLSKTLLARADAILCPSLEFQDVLARISGRPDATRLYHIGIDLSRFRPGTTKRERPRVVMIGRFVEKKGHLVGIEAFATAIARGIDAELSIIGTGPLELQYREAIERHRLGDRVSMLGALDAQQVAEVLRDADVLMAPSQTARDGDRESGVIVLKEASACGLPVIGTRHGGIPEIIDDTVTGYLVEERDAPAIAERLAAVLMSPDLRGRLGAAGRAKMEREYDVRARVADLESIYDSLS
jgi:colanic acid/amylovoran biosynthesis glycosyltransferase